MNIFKTTIIKKVLSILFILFLVSALTGCISFAFDLANLGSSDYKDPSSDEVVNFEVDDDAGYVYGRFFRAYTTAKYSMHEATTYVVISNIKTGDKIRFINDYPSEETLQIAAVPPGDYEIVTIGTIDSLGNIIDSDTLRVTSGDEYDFEGPKSSFQDIINNEILVGYTREFTVEKGKAIYLGDFVTVMTDEGYSLMYSPLPPLDNFTETTVALGEKYPEIKEKNITFVSNMDSYLFKEWDRKFVVFNYYGEVVDYEYDVDKAPEGEEIEASAL